MTPKDVTMLLTAAVQEFPPIVGCPSDDNLKNIKYMLSPILIAIPYDSIDKVHNLWGVIAPTLAYIRQYMDAFSNPTRPSRYPNISNKATNSVRAWEESVEVARHGDTSHGKNQVNEAMDPGHSVCSPKWRQAAAEGLIHLQSTACAAKR